MREADGVWLICFDPSNELSDRFYRMKSRIFVFLVAPAIYCSLISQKFATGAMFSSEKLVIILVFLELVRRKIKLVFVHLWINCDGQALVYAWYDLVSGRLIWHLRIVILQHYVNLWENITVDLEIWLNYSQKKEELIKQGDGLPLNSHSFVKHNWENIGWYPVFLEVQSIFLIEKAAG